ncbi:hypothetical protein D3C71_197600 [compost metagenome]
MRIALLTSNHHKAQEIASALGSHGQKMTAVPIDGDTVEIAKIQALLDEGYDFVLREETCLFNPETDAKIEGTPDDMATVINKSGLAAWRQGEGRRIIAKQYISEVHGFIDADLRVADEDVYGWDDIFVPIDSGLSLHDMKHRHIKTSARQLSVGRFLADHVHFSSRLDMRFFPMNQDRTFEFNSKAFDFITTNPLIAAGTSGTYLENILWHVLRSGVFFRSAANRKEKNYWLPGLNAGIPLTQKKDPIHEITFLFHDIMHFQLPDLIPDWGGSIARDVYVTHRIIGEALTLVLADMIFIDNMSRSGVEYDFSKRLIYPLYQNMDVGRSLADMRSVVKAMALYAVRGDDRLLRSLLKPGQEAMDALEAFKGKYGRFFEEDLRWTEHNFDQFASQRDYIDRWLDEIVGRENLLASGLETVTSFALGLDDRKGEKDLFDAIFDLVFERVARNATTEENCAAGLSTSNAFKRYMIGQLSIFARYSDVLDAPAIRKKLMSMVSNPKELGEAEISGMTGLYETYVRMLERRNLIDHSDALTYRSMHPVFPPFYVFYDTKKS